MTSARRTLYLICGLLFLMSPLYKLSMFDAIFGMAFGIIMLAIACFYPKVLL